MLIANAVFFGGGGGGVWVGGLNFGLSFHIHIYTVYISSNGSAEPDQKTCVDSSFDFFHRISVRRS